MISLIFSESIESSTDVAAVEIDAEDLEVDVHFLANFDCFLESEFVDSDGLFAIADSLADEVGLGEDGITHFNIAKILFCVFDLIVKLLELL